MHPSLQAKFGLRTSEDVAIAEHAMSAARKAGWTDAQIHGVLQYYATVAPALERGQIEPQAALHQLWDFAKLEGVGEEQRAGLLNWHETTSDFMDSHPGELPPMSRPSAAAVREERTEIERIQREEPDRYWRDEALQNRLYDLIADSHGDAPPAIASRAHITRLGKLEKLMGDPSSAYWNPKTGPALQAEYRTILDMADPRPASRVASAAPSRSSGRRAEIEKMMADTSGDYWRGPQADQIQNEYRALLSAPEAAAPASTTSTTSTNGES
jgi:hypothetical protein